MIVFAYLLLCACWSTTWQAIRLCLSGYPPLVGAALRFLLATVLLAAMYSLGRRREAVLVSRQQHVALAAAGLFNGLGYACVYLAEQTLSGGTAAILCATSPLFTLLLARLVGLEPLLWYRLVGMLLGLFGVTLLFLEGLEVSRDHFQAMLLAGCAAAFLWPLYGTLLKRYAQQLPPLLSTSYFLFYTGLTLSVLSALRGEPLPAFRLMPLAAHAGLLYLTIVGSVVAWSIYLWLLQRLELSVLSALGLIQPVLAIGIDLVLHEAQLRPRGYIGTALVLAGMALSTLRTILGSSERPAATA